MGISRARCWRITSQLSAFRHALLAHLSPRRSRRSRMAAILRGANGKGEALAVSIIPNPSHLFPACLSSALSLPVWGAHRSMAT